MEKINLNSLLNQIRNPPSLLIVAGIIIFILEEPKFGKFLIICGVGLQVMWMLTNRNNKNKTSKPIYNTRT